MVRACTLWAQRRQRRYIGLKTDGGGCIYAPILLKTVMRGLDQFPRFRTEAKDAQRSWAEDMTLDGETPPAEPEGGVRRVGRLDAPWPGVLLGPA